MSQFSAEPGVIGRHIISEGHLQTRPRNEPLYICHEEWRVTVLPLVLNRTLNLVMNLALKMAEWQIEQ